MAATASKTSSRLRLVFYAGEDLVSGKPIYKARSFPLKSDATDQGVYDVAETLKTLQQRPLYNVERVDKFDIQQGV